MFKQSFFFISVCTLLSLTSCAGPSINFATPVELEETLSSSTQLSTSTLVAPTSTNEVSVTESLVDECTQLIETPSFVEKDDQWILLRESQAPYRPYLLNNGIKSFLPTSPDEIIFEVGVSLDNKLLAYVTGTAQNMESKNITVIDMSGKVIKNIQWEENWTAFWGWLDNEHLMVTQKISDDQRTPSLIILDIYNNTTEELSSDYPNFDNVTYLPWQYNRVIYNPTLTTAIYPSYAQKSSTITFFDLKKNQVLIEFPAILAFTMQPVWSPDEQYIVVAETVANRGTDESGNRQYDQELILLDKNGIITRLTHFTDKYTNVELGSLSWSPNGQYIAFWFSIGDMDQEQLAVFDFNTNKVTNYCVPGFNQHIGNTPEPVWSNDSQIILVNNKDEVESLGKVLWVDIKNQSGGILGEEMSISGWLISP